MRLFFSLLLSLFIAARVHAQEVFVSPKGDDGNPGSIERPFQTLERGRTAARTYHQSTPAATRRAFIVWLRDGTYSLASTFELTRDDAGSPGAPVTYAAYGIEPVRLSGGITIPSSSFHPASDPGTLRRLPVESRQHVLQADLRALGIRDFGKHRQFGHGLPVVPAPMELFWNDSVMQLARYPNTGAIDLGTIIDPGSMPRDGDYSNRGGKFRYTDKRHARWAGVSDVWLQGFFNHGFSDDKIRIASIDTVQQEVTLSSPHMYSLASGQNFNQYVALNVLEELDQRGEWYVDTASGMLFLWPPGDIAATRVTVSILEQPLIALDNTSYCTLRDLVIENGRGLGVSLEGGTNNRIVNCVVRNVGTVGIMLGQGARQTFPHITADDYEGVPSSREVGSFHSHMYRNTVWDRNAGEHHVIEGCEVYNTGSGGIILGGGSKKNLVPGGNVVTDCRIHDFNRRNKAGAAGVIVDGCGNLVAHNEIYNADLQAMLVHGNDHVFEYNHIHHVALNSNDASAWYLGRDPSDQGNVVRWNFFHHVGRPDRKWMMGVYCDDATCDVRIEGNIFYRVASYGTVYSNGGHDIVVKNNIFIEGYGPAYQLKSMWYDFGISSIPYFFGEKGIYTRRLTKDVDIRKPPYSERYPLLKDWLDLLPDGRTYVGMRPRRNVFGNNVLVKHEETFRLVGQYAQTEFGENYITDKDPGFVDAAQLDFRLKDNSVVYKELPGFKRIPFEQIGPRKPGDRK
ncbi:MAG: right-handed parallel beta-helix repeat-containing protein [Ignavibacteriales bacterium]|nr:right-handed parallel beta-helix repeat-containing protein [Ignavibacteriales bacterium]